MLNRIKQLTTKGNPNNDPILDYLLNDLTKQTNDLNHLLDTLNLISHNPYKHTTKKDT